MLDFLDWRDLAGTGSSYLDVGACYGWFVAEMARRGFHAHGVELDANAVKLGTLAYGLEPGAVTVAEGADFLRRLEQPADVVSCFSVLHHFVLGAGSCSAEELIELLDRATGRVLLLDTGEAHEEWFRELLPAWSSEFVGEWLSAHTTFRDVVALGTDRDAVPPFEDNYGRTLFACVR
jgi:SAM-dependent methyltransferase